MRQHEGIYHLELPMPETPISFTLNGRPVACTVPDHRLFRDFLREEMRLTGTKGACQDGMCGSCSVLVDSQVVKSCLLLAAEIDGRSVTTIEGLANGSGELHPVQQAFIDNFAFQCGFCTPGFIMTICAIIRENPDLTIEEAREALIGNICRCTGYTKILEAAVDAAGRIRNGDNSGGSTSTKV
jgi:carbon-monoxide dehydrogenase small subunit